MAEPDGFTEFASAHAARLRRTAYLLCGDWHTAQDLAQTALAKVFVAWRRITAVEGAYAYAQRTLVNAYLGQQRRRAARETPTDRLPDTTAPEASPEVGIVLRQALSTLRPTARAVVVMRYWADLPVAEVAEVLGMSEGAVRVQALRALDRLRGVLGDAYQDLIRT